jgi:23S rRNA (adenine2503-C2)-methyltransferase
MLDEVLFTQIDSGLPVSRVVLMGIGEPLDNFNNAMRFLELVNSEEGMNISMRHISLSTCGLIPKIDELAKRKLQISLAISLHGPNDEIRDKIMPVNKAYPSEDLINACRHYYEATSRRIHFEYAMIDGVNDRERDAKELLRRLKGLPAHFNLIPLNHVEESPLKPSSKAAVARFQKILEDGGITATVRRTLGGDIDASCGQLRRKYNKETH